jgi:hypothetical protein
MKHAAGRCPWRPHLGGAAAAAEGLRDGLRVGKSGRGAARRGVAGVGSGAGGRERRRGRTAPCVFPGGLVQKGRGTAHPQSKLGGMHAGPPQPLPGKAWQGKASHEVGEPCRAGHAVLPRAHLGLGLGRLAARGGALGDGLAGGVGAALSHGLRARARGRGRGLGHACARLVLNRSTRFGGWSGAGAEEERAGRKSGGWTARVRRCSALQLVPAPRESCKAGSGARARRAEPLSRPRPALRAGPLRAPRRPRPGPSEGATGGRAPRRHTPTPPHTHTHTNKTQENNLARACA